MSFFNYFTDSERGAVNDAANLKNRVFGSFGPALARLHVHPDAISYAGLAMLTGVVIWFMAHPFRTVFMLVLYVAVDGLDGAYARYLNRPSQSGAFTDIVVDQLGMVVMALGFIQYRMVDGQIGAYYIMIYLIMITFSVIQNAQGIPMQYIFRSKYILYGIYALWAFTRINLAPVLIPLFSIIMTVSVAQSFLRLKTGIYWKYDFPVHQARDQELRAHGGSPARFWPSLNVIIPGMVVLLLAFIGAYTQVISMAERANVRPQWKESPLPFLEVKERPRALTAWKDGWLVTAYNPLNRFTRVYYLDRGLALRGRFRVPWALHRDHGACAGDGRLYIADRFSRYVFEIDVDESLKSGIAALDQSFDTTLNAPVGCAIVESGGKRAMLVSEYMNLHQTILVDYKKAFESGTAQGAIMGWYRNGGFSRGIASDGHAAFEMNSSLWRDLIYAIDLDSALDDNYIRTGITAKIAAPRWNCRDLAVSNGVIALVDGETRKLYLSDLPPSLQ
ncbi:MAG TPA: CDP-alcohol phosphatidyltransferase family protein [bacterium]|nr:CDP-alcohol phosphatidyltransferase family protein [bacterium]